MYRPYNLRGTIWEAAVELKAKIIDQLPILKIHDHVKDKYFYALHFGKFKFPPLPSSPLALAFGHLVPVWFYCPISYVQNASKRKKADRVVPTKYYLPDYLGPLHIDPRYVSVFETTQLGNAFLEI